MCPSRYIAYARWRAGISPSIWRKKRAWSLASMRELPQIGAAGAKRRMWAGRASARGRLCPTCTKIADAAALSERRIIGPRRARAVAERPVAHGALVQVGDEQHRLEHARRREGP